MGDTWDRSYIVPDNDLSDSEDDAFWDAPDDEDLADLELGDFSPRVPTYPDNPLRPGRDTEQHLRRTREATDTIMARVQPRSLGSSSRRDIEEGDSGGETLESDGEQSSFQPELAEYPGQSSVRWRGDFTRAVAKKSGILPSSSPRLRKMLEVKPQIDTSRFTSVEFSGEIVDYKFRKTGAAIITLEVPYEFRDQTIALRDAFGTTLSVHIKHDTS